MLKRKAEESFNGSKNHICNDLDLIHPENILEIDIVSVIDFDDSFTVKNIIGEIREQP